MSNNKIIVQRLYAELEYPSNFILVAAMNPCKCSWYKHFECPKCGHVSLSKDGYCNKHKVKLQSKCTCSNTTIESYKKKLSGPLLDRIDLKVMLSSFDKSIIEHDYATSTFKKEIADARIIQQERFKKTSFISCNADVPDAKKFEEFDTVDKEVNNHLYNVYKQYNIGSKRVEVKLLLVSRTIADLEASRRIQKKHIDLATELMGINDDYFKDF